MEKFAKPHPNVIQTPVRMEERVMIRILVSNAFAQMVMLVTLAKRVIHVFTIHVETTVVVII